MDTLPCEPVDPGLVLGVNELERGRLCDLGYWLWSGDVLNPSETRA